MSLIPIPRGENPYFIFVFVCFLFVCFLFVFCLFVLFCFVFVLCLSMCDPHSILYLPYVRQSRI